MTVNVELHSISSRPAALKAKFDTGAQGKLLPLRLYHRTYPENLTLEGFHKSGVLEHSPTVFKAYGRPSQCNMGSAELIVSLTAGNQEQLSLSQIQMDWPLLSCQHAWSSTLSPCSVQQGSLLNSNCTCEQVTSIEDKDDLVKCYPDCFDGVGKFQVSSIFLLTCL